MPSPPLPSALIAATCCPPPWPLLQVTKEQLRFRSPFSIVAKRNDFIHAFVAWFDIEFSCCHKPVRFSTSPAAKYTHWKQTVFYLDTVLTVNKGEEVRGFLACKPNDKNPRDLDIDVEYQFDGAHGRARKTQPFRLR